MFQKAVTHYQKTLKTHEGAHAYLQERGVFDLAVLQELGIGFCDGTFNKKYLPNHDTRHGRRERRELQEDGFLDHRGMEVCRNCITFPIFDDQGKLQEIYGRKISKKLRSKQYHVQTHEQSDALWNRLHLGEGEIILCKGLLDALSFYIQDYRNVTSLFGTNTFSKSHIQQFRSLGVKRIYLAFGGKSQDLEAHVRIGRQLQQAGFVIFRLMFPRDMDPNAYAVKYPLKQLMDYAEVDDFLGESKSEQAPAQHENFEEDELHVLEQEGFDGWDNEDFECREAIEGDEVVEDGEYSDEKAKIEHVPDGIEGALESDNKRTNTEREKKITKTESNDEPKSTTPKPEGADSVEIQDKDIACVIGDRHYRIRGLYENQSIDSMKIMLRLQYGSLVFVDSVEMYANKQRQTFAKQASTETGVKEDIIKKDLVRILLELEQIQDGHVRKTLAPFNLDEAERNQALSFLKDPNLIDRIAKDLESSGLVGEAANKLVGYIAMTSRKLNKPLALMVQSTSAAGKSTLLDTLLSFVPKEDQHKYSSITPQSLYYMAEQGIRHKILAIAEGEGALNASYSLKLLQSEGELTISSTGGSKKGLTAKQYSVEGPVMIAMTTTAIDVDEELLNRCMVLTVDESRKQTRAIHETQRLSQTLEGMLEKEVFQKTLKLHQNAQRLLKPLRVVNPYAPQLTFLDEKTRLRRDHTKYLTLIQAVAFLHQYQRPIKKAQIGDQVIEYIEVSLQDIDIANKLAHHVLGVTLDELPPHTRKLLEIIHQFTNNQCQEQEIERSEFRFSRKDLRDHCHWGNTQLKIHLKRLVEHEYLTLHTYKRKHLYECLYNGEGQSGERFLMGLMDTKKLKTLDQTSIHDHQSIPTDQKCIPDQKDITDHQDPDDTKTNKNVPAKPKRSGFQSQRSGHGRLSVGA